MLEYFYIIEPYIKTRLPPQLSDVRLDFSPSNEWSPSKSIKVVVPYGVPEQAAVSKLDNHTIPKQYAPLIASKAMIDVMTKLALDSRMCTEYKVDRHAFARSMPDLSDKERDALEKGTLWEAQGAMRDLSTLDKRGEIEGRPNSAVNAVFVINFAVIVSVNDMTGVGVEAEA